MLLQIMFVFCVLAAPLGVWAGETYDLRGTAEALDSTHCPLLEPAAIARAAEDCFVPFGAVPERLDATIAHRPVTWYRVPVPATVAPAAAWHLHLSFMVASGELYDFAPSGILRSHAAIGMSIPVADRAVRAYEDQVPLPLLHRGDTLVVRVAATRRAFEPFELKTAAAIHATDDDIQRAYYGPVVFLNGVLMAMALFNLLLFFRLHRRSYLLYSLSMLAMVAFQTIQSGLAWTLVWPHLAVTDDYPAYVTYFIYFALVTAFTRSFLELRRTAPLADTVLLVALGILLLDTVLYVIFPGVVAVSRLWSVIDPLAVLVITAALLYAGIAAWQRGVVSARAYVIGCAGAATGLLFAEAGDYGVVALPIWDDVCAAIGVAWEAIFLAFALAERLRFAEREASRLTEYAYNDQLTGIPNRRAFDEVLEREWRRSIRLARPVSLLMFDIDRFKEYNDHFGHQAGDVALRVVARTIDGAARRAGDFAARYGGEEFALVLSETSREGALATAELVRGAIYGLSILSEGGPLTVSVGCATVVPTDEKGADLLIALADHALYDAKREGRNRSVAATVLRAASEADA